MANFKMATVTEPNMPGSDGSSLSQPWRWKNYFLQREGVSSCSLRARHLRRRILANQWPGRAGPPRCSWVRCSRAPRPGGPGGAQPGPARPDPTRPGLALLVCKPDLCNFVCNIEQYCTILAICTIYKNSCNMYNMYNINVNIVHQIACNRALGQRL